MICLGISIICFHERFAVYLRNSGSIGLDGKTFYIIMVTCPTFVSQNISIRIELNEGMIPSAICIVFQFIFFRNGSAVCRNIKCSNKAIIALSFIGQGKGIGIYFSPRMKIHVIRCIMPKFSSLSYNIVSDIKGFDPATPLVSITSIIPAIGKGIGILINFN